MHPTLAAARELIDRPIPGGKWSVRDILEHLTLAYAGNAMALERTLDSGQVKARKPALKELVARVLVVDIGYFPRAESPAAAMPTGSIPAAGSLAAIRGALDRVDHALARIADRFGGRIAVSNHPYFGGLTVPEWRRFHLRHTRHHMRQVRERSA